MTSTNNQVAAPGTVLILGSAGRLGLSVARAFARAGWAVLAQVRPTRDVAQLPEISGVEWLPHALDDLASLVAKAQGASVVVHALNPCYCNIAWRREGPTMMEQAIDVTRRLQATLMFPGNVYNFGSSMPEILSEATPQLATDSKGRVRIAVEQQLAAAARAGGLRAVVIRAGDYFGSGEGSWFDQVLSKNLWKGQITYPGKLDTAHVTNRAPLEPPNRGLMEPVKGREFGDSDGAIFSRFSVI